MAVEAFEGPVLSLGEAGGEREEACELSYSESGLTCFHSLNCDVASLGSVIDLNRGNIAASLGWSA